MKVLHDLSKHVGCYSSALSHYCKGGYLKGLCMNLYVCVCVCGAYSGGHIAARHDK